LGGEKSSPFFCSFGFLKHSYIYRYKQKVIKMGQKKGNPTPSYQNEAYEALRPNTNARENRDMGTKPVMIDDTKTLDELIDSGSQGFTQGYAKDTDLTDGTINARFDTLTANEYHVTILSSSVMYANGSNKLGDSADDRHEFTGSILVGGGELSIRLNQATQSLQSHSASVDTQLARVYQTTASLNTYTGSLIGITNGLMAVTASMKAATIFSGSVQIGLTLSNYANDGAAASGGVPVGGLYHTTGTVKVRLT
jgi:hypothetical protein